MHLTQEKNLFFFGSFYFVGLTFPVSKNEYIDAGTDGREKLHRIQSIYGLTVISGHIIKPK